MPQRRYDTNGNLTGDGTYALGYDAENRLVSASGAGNTASYAYDAQGRRKLKTVNGTSTAFATGADNREVLEYDGTSGQVLRWYAYGLGPNAVLNRMDVPGNTRETPIADLQGSIIGSLSSAGTLTKTQYASYGGNAGTAPAPFGYTGQRRDAETTLYYYRARMYHPAWGRFAQVDPIGYDGGANLYAYVGNDPLNLVDPNGELGQIGVGALAGFVVEIGFQLGSGELRGALSAAYGGSYVPLAQSIGKVVVSTLTGAATGGVSSYTRAVADVGAKNAIAYGAQTVVGSVGGSAKSLISGEDAVLGAIAGGIGGGVGRYASNVTQSIASRYVSAAWAESGGAFVQGAFSAESKFVSGLVQQGIKYLLPGPASAGEVGQYGGAWGAK